MSLPVNLSWSTSTSPSPNVSLLKVSLSSTVIWTLLSHSFLSQNVIVSSKTTL